VKAITGLVHSGEH